MHGYMRGYMRGYDMATDGEVAEVAACARQVPGTTDTVHTACWQHRARVRYTCSKAAENEVSAQGRFQAQQRPGARRRAGMDCSGGAGKVVLAKGGAAHGWRLR